MTQLNVLLVDDDDDLRETLADGLEASGYSVHQFNNIEILYNKLSVMNIHVAIIDLVLAGANGAALVGFIKRHPRLQHIHVLMISGVAHGRSVAEMWGADQFLAKPVSIAQLCASVQQLVHSP